MTIILWIYGLLEFNWSHSFVSGIILLLIAALFFAYLCNAVKKEGDKLLIGAALLFYVSDAVLAIDKFKQPIKIDKGSGYTKNEVDEQLN